MTRVAGFQTDRPIRSSRFDSEAAMKVFARYLRWTFLDSKSCELVERYQPAMVVCNADLADRVEAVAVLGRKSNLDEKSTLPFKHLADDAPAHGLDGVDYLRRVDPISCNCG